MEFSCCGKTSLNNNLQFPHILEQTKQCMQNVAKFMEKLESFDKPITKDSEYVDCILEMMKGSEPYCNIKHFIKSSMRAKQLRKEGNERYTKQDFYGAYRLYTKSVAFAIPGTEDLGFAYANRSAVLFENHYYKECLEDIERALQNKYPENKTKKLHQRREKAKSSIQSRKKTLYHATAPNLSNKNEEIPSASPNIKIQTDPDGSRKIVAKNRIKAGDILLIEEPFIKVASCYRTIRYIHCNECMELCYNMIPCSKCPFALYCSIACRREAFIKYHRYECIVVQLLDYSVPILICLRLTLAALKEYTIAKDTSTDHVFRSDRYKEVQTLNAKVNKLTPDRRLILAIIPAFCYRILTKKTDLLLQYDFENNQTVIKELLVRNSFISLFNTRYIEKFDSEAILKKTVGAGLYTVFSLFNHSCVNNVETTFYGTKLALYAKKNIKVGEECFVNFGCSFIDVPKDIRQNMLQENFTTCACKACTNNWPTTVELMLKDFSMSHNIVQMNKEFDDGKITNKRKFLADCCRFYTDLREVEWSLNKTILNMMISKCIFSMGNSDIPF